MRAVEDIHVRVEVDEPKTASASRIQEAVCVSIRLLSIS